jgi:hypothetical protein
LGRGEWVWDEEGKYGEGDELKEGTIGEDINERTFHMSRKVTKCWSV